MVDTIDERIQNIIISSYMNTYEDSILTKEQYIDNYIHKADEIGNSYQLLVLVVPKNMLLLNGMADRPFLLEGTKKHLPIWKEFTLLM